MSSGQQYAGAGPVMGPANAAGGEAANMQALAASSKPKERKKPKRKVLTSLILEIFIYFGYLWDAFYYPVNILVFIYKGIVLPYTERNFAMEFCFSWFWIFIEIPRAWLVSHGNLTENSSPIFFGTSLAIPLFAMYAYFLAFQTYVLYMDRILNWGAIIILAIQVVWSILVWFKFVFFTRFAP